VSWQITLAFLLCALASNLFAQTSPDGMRIPPGQIIDAQGVVWKLGIIANHTPQELIPVVQMVYCNQTVYALNGADKKWYTGKPGTAWTLVGTIDPCK
jgi:hypothetical protein